MEKDSKNVVVTIKAETIFRVMLILLLAAGIYYFWDLVLIVLMAVVIASATEPAVLCFRKFKVPRIVAVVMIYLSFAVGVGALLFFFVPVVLDDAASFLSTIPEYLDTKVLLGPLREYSPQILKPGIDGLSQTFSLTEVVNGLRATLTESSGGVFKILSAVFGSIVSLILVIVLSFYLSVQDDGVVDFLSIITPTKHKKYIIDLWRRSQYKIGRWMQGQLFLGLIVGLIVYLILAILRVEHALLLAVLAAALEILPVFGPILAAIPAMLVVFMSGFYYIPGGGLSAVLVIAGSYVLVQQFENNLIYPLVVRKVVGVPPILVIIALIIGARLAGFLGIILSVPIAAAVIEFVRDVERKKVVEEQELEGGT